MRNSFLGYGQRQSVNLGLSMDDLAFLRWFTDFRDSNKMKRKYDPESNNMIYWIDYQKAVEDLPIIFNPDSDIKARKKKLQRMLAGNLGNVLERVPEKNVSKSITGKGKISTIIYIRINEDNYNLLVEDKSVSHKEDKNVPHKENNENEDGEPNKADSTEGQNCPVNKLTDKPSMINALSSSIEEKEAEELKAIMKHCQRCNFKLSKDKALILLATYDYLQIVKAITKSTTSNEPVKNPYNYLLTILGDMETNKIVNVDFKDKSKNKDLKFNNFEGRGVEYYANHEDQLRSWMDEE